MEIKKSPKADLENKRGLFLEIGLVVALGLSILMFSWNQQDRVVEKLDLGTVEVEEEIVEITRQDQKPPEPQKQTIAVASDIIQIVKNDTKVSTDFDFNVESSEDQIVVAPVKVEAEEVMQEDTPFLTAEVMPTFQGKDLNAFRSWVQERLKYPVIAAENGVQGRVVVAFVVEKDGSVGRAQVLVAPDKSLGEEALRVIMSSPKWTPGKQRGNAVPVKYNLPVEFKLQ